jgi:hypothetical protein
LTQYAKQKPGGRESPGKKERAGIAEKTKTGGTPKRTARFVIL